MIGNVSQFWRLTRELDVNALREEFERPASIQILGSDQRSAERVRALLVPARAIGDDSVFAGTLAGWLASRSDRRSPADVVIAVLGASLDPVSRRALTDLSIDETPLLLVQLESSEGLMVLGVPEEHIVTFAPGEADHVSRARLMDALVASCPEAMLSLGRRLPTLRDAVATHLIRDSSRVNAQFAAVSSIPASLPLVGGMVGDVADMVVLTKNQVILLFKLAGLYGRDLRLGQRLVLEILPVVGGAFFWRSTARALVGLLPTIVSVVPKAVIAYSGTFVVGEMARYYYREGQRPPPELVDDLRRQGLDLARRTLERVRGR